MKNFLSITLLCIFLSVNFYSCSDDDKEIVCSQTNVTITINDEVKNFQAIGRGIDLRANGYELQINLYRSESDPFIEESISIKLPYKRTGENIIEQFQYNQYMNGVFFSGDFLNGEFQSNVISNTNKCFSATFSGVLSDDNQEVIITDGQITYQYDEPFD